ncbi:MAG: hypothetical protein LBK66_12630 [Spirochaetaceae bacterium]|jgi:hypothetical protein|nr:hypothetical protein [Spirochaetaceae bacterium]
MLGFLITIKNNDGKILARIAEHSNDRISIFGNLENMEKEGKSKCILNEGGYPYKYSAKACDIMPLIEKWLDTLPEWEPRLKGISWMMGYGITPDLPVETTKNKSEIPIYSSDETLVIELWDLS